MAAGAHRRRGQDAWRGWPRRSSRRWRRSRRSSSSRRPRSMRASRRRSSTARMLDQLQRDDLPRFEARFKELLNENTINEIANFQSQLARERETIKERIDAHQRVADADRLQPRPLHRAGGAAEPGRRDPRLPDRAARLHRGRADRLGRRAVFGSQVPAGQGDHRALPRPRGTVRARPPLDRQGDRRAQLVRVRRQRALARGRRGARALLGLRRQVGRAEGEARLHHPGREPRLPVRAGVGRGALAVVPLRGHRRGLRPRLGRVGAVRPAAVPAAQPAAADRHAAAEDPHHRALRRQRRLRAQRRRPRVAGCAT